MHPGYGYLSESPEFARQMAAANVMVIGPSSTILEQTGDKLQARQLAVECKVPVLPALLQPTWDVAAIRSFAETHVLPIMVKAVDGGGGRGIRLVRTMETLRSLTERAIAESPSKQVFAEKAAIDGYRHVEVQIVGDGKGNVMHLWERECSIQRRYQKVIEIAPSSVTDRRMVAPVIEAALRMARKIRYASLGTFEFLLNPSTKEFWFLEVNPRLQVEHTITESICSIDLVRAQLLLAQGMDFEQAGLGDLGQDSLVTPQQCSIQLRITAEDPKKDYALSIGKISSFHFPGGNGVRVDTALIGSSPMTVGSDFDSLIAKLVITARTWSEAVSKASRALEDTAIVGVKTNLALLRAVVVHTDFKNGLCDTRWLESRHEELLAASRELPVATRSHNLMQPQSAVPSSTTAASSSALFRRDDAFSIELEQLPRSSAPSQSRHLQITRVLRNDFPTTFAAEILFTKSGTAPEAYKMELHSTATSASAASAEHRQGSSTDSTHVILPLSGKLVEVLVDIGDTVRLDDPICVVKQMKMEIEIRSHKAGKITWVTDAEDDTDVAEGMLAAVVEDEILLPKL